MKIYTEVFSLKGSMFEISTDGIVRKILENGAYEYPKLEIINNRCYAVFSNLKLSVVDKMIFYFLNFKVLNNSVHYKDGNLLNTSISNILLSQQNIIERTGKFEGLRSVKNAVEYRLENINTLTIYEKSMNKICKELDLKYNKQAVFFNEKSFYILDFYFQKYQVAIEIDGVHHYESLKTFFYDQDRDNFLKENYGIEVIRIPNFIIKNKKDELKEILKEKILQKRCKDYYYLLTDFFKNKINILCAVKEVFIQFSIEVRGLNNYEKSLVELVTEKIGDKIPYSLPTKREYQLLKIIIYSILKNGTMFWTIKDLRTSCNGIGKEVKEFYVSKHHVKRQLQVIQLYLRDIIEIKKVSEKITAPTVFRFSLPSNKI